MNDPAKKEGCSTEHAIIVERSGKVVHFKGSDVGVDIFDVNLDGAHVLHNHPASNGYVSFGPDDFSFIKANQSCIYDVCNDLYDYRLEVKRDISKLSYSELYREALMNHQIGAEVQDETMTLLSKKGYIFYEKRPIK